MAVHSKICKHGKFCDRDLSRGENTGFIFYSHTCGDIVVYPSRKHVHQCPFIGMYTLQAGKGRGSWRSGENERRK